MSRRGWAYQRREKCRALFGIGFPGGRGRTIVLDLRMLQLLDISAAHLAEYLTCEAAVACNHDMRRALA